MLPSFYLVSSPPAVFRVVLDVVVEPSALGRLEEVLELLADLAVARLVPLVALGVPELEQGRAERHALLQHQLFGLLCKEKSTLVKKFQMTSSSM